MLYAKHSYGGLRWSRKLRWKSTIARVRADAGSQSGAHAAAQSTGRSGRRPDVLDSVVRLVRLVDTPRDYAVLAPLAAREIVYRLAVGEQGGRLRQIALIRGRAHRITKAIELIRKDYDKPLGIAGLARQLGM